MIPLKHQKTKAFKISKVKTRKKTIEFKLAKVNSREHFWLQGELLIHSLKKSWFWFGIWWYILLTWTNCDKSHMFWFLFQPQLPAYVFCLHCDEGRDEGVLMECSVCAEVVHPKCLKKTFPCKISRKVNNLWECPDCCESSDDEVWNIFGVLLMKWPFRKFK